MKVLIACEFSGVVRRAFAKAGHMAISCDILPSDDNSINHIHDNVLAHLDDNWDLIIAHPPCTHLCNSGARWFKDKREEQALAKQFFLTFTELKCAWAIENPIGIMSTYYRKPDQIIHPWQFGHGETKATCLWLNKLPLLTPTNVVAGRVPRIHFMSPSKDRGKKRSVTYQGIADAMADQWNTRTAPKEVKS